ncbi:tetratricopeptide repeat protein [Melioribacter sp. Ez-97]|uniref:tetratricopeptide repeat protein n=1 Tax=Melioribacter sp. Ez-97 TaxID=3423434 RepID=UPI003ED893E9
MSFKKSFYGNRFFIVIFTLLALCEALLSRFPLFNTFDYEFSALNGIILFFAGGFIFLKYSGESDNVIAAYRRAAIKLSSIALLVLISGFMLYLFVNRCPVEYGIAFYLIITAPSLLLGATSAYVIKLIFKKYRILIFILFSIMLLSLPLIEFYFYPQIYFYNPLFGYFSGTIYDESITVTNKLIYYRAFNLLTGFVILLTAVQAKKRRLLNNKILAIVIVGLLFTIWMFKPIFGFATSRYLLQKELGLRIETQHARIYAPADYRYGKYAALLFEYYYERLNDIFESKDERIQVYIFKDNKQKKELFGSGNADVTKPWANQIFTDINSFESTLKHEIVHALTAKYSNPPFYIPLNPALLEGVASALDNNYYGYPVHYMAKTAYDNGFRADIKKLFTDFSFYSNYAGVSYVYAGSFVKYLMDKYGIKSAIEYYGANDFIKTFGKPLDQAIEEYYEFLQSLPGAKNKEAAQLYFGGKPIFKKTCVRYAARETNRGYRYYNQGDFLKSAQIFENVYSGTKSYASLLGIVRSYIALEKYSEAGKILSKEIKYFKESPYIYALKIFYADVSALENDFEGALGLYKEIKNRKINPGYYFNSSLKIYLVEQNSIGEYLKGDKIIKKKILFDALQNGVYEALYELCDLMNKKDDFILVLKCADNMDNSNENNIFLLMKLSRSALKHGYLKIAKEIAVKAAKGIQNIYWREMTSENLRMINWFVNFSSETKFKTNIPDYD